MGRNKREPGDDEAIRACLGPLQPRHLFLSRWKGNRICDRCTRAIHELETGFGEFEVSDGGRKNAKQV